MLWRYIALIIILAVVVSLGFVITLFIFSFLKPALSMSTLELYLKLALIEGTVTTLLILAVFRLSGMRIVVRDGKVLLVGGLAGRDEK